MFLHFYWFWLWCPRFPRVLGSLVWAENLQLPKLLVECFISKCVNQLVSYWIGHFLSYGFLSVFFQCHRSPSDSFKMTDQYNIGRSMEYCIYYCILLNILYILTCHKDIFTTGKMLFIASIDTVDPILGSCMPNGTIKGLMSKVDGLLGQRKWTVFGVLQRWTV